MAKKWLIFMGVIGTIAVGYHFVSVLTLQRSLTRSLELPIDTILPLLPWTVLFYVSLYFFWLPPIFSKNITTKDFLRIITAVGGAFAVALLINIIIPSAYPRPEITTAQASNSWTEYILKQLYAIDLPNNTFPSSHVVTAVALVIMVAPYFKKWTYRAYSSWGALISLSTLTVKQHYVADVVTGIVVAVLATLLVKKLWPHQIKTEKNSAIAEVV